MPAIKLRVALWSVTRAASFSRELMALAPLLVISVSSELTFAGEERPDSPPGAHTFDRFDRTFVHINGQSAHVESRRRHAAHPERNGNEADQKDLVEVRFSPGVFERFVYGPKDDEDLVGHRLESALAYRVDSLSRMFKLDAAQEKKLLQAGHGDLRRIRERVNELKKRFAEPDLIEDDHPTTVRAWASERIKEAVVLRDTLARADPFHEGSMLEKVLRRQLTPEQIADYEEHELRLRSALPRGKKNARQAF